MGRRTQTIAPDYFEQLYADDGDPWKFASSDYERIKYIHTLEALARPRYENALEVGCSIGVLTQLLAQKCDRLLALDAAAAPLAAARLRCEAEKHVAFAQGFVPGQWPVGAFDLILLSEVVYYLDTLDVARLAEKVREALVPGGDVVLVHWTGETDYPLTGDEAAEFFIGRLGEGFEVVRGDRRREYRLDALRRR